jgi:hypothetical protein
VNLSTFAEKKRLEQQDSKNVKSIYIEASPFFLGLDEFCFIFCLGRFFLSWEKRRRKEKKERKAFCEFCQVIFLRFLGCLSVRLGLASFVAVPSCGSVAAAHFA